MESTQPLPPRLKALELQGYKTFAGKTTFAFGRTITAIVGPNGSGKSNIADSLRWVLGEQSYGLLRGKRTEDMIFAGSEARPRAGMAAATITFDNADGWLPIDFTEVSISRRAYRDSQNEYLLNNQRVRLRDVSELLAECGLAQRTYTIIGQGLVDDVLSLKAEERRRFFEEAAGIGLYRARREEAVRRLDATLHNLERAQDILAELIPRVRSLERQARRAAEYDQVRADLKSALRIWYGFHWSRMQQQVSEAARLAEDATQERDALRADQEATDRQLSALRSHIDARRAELHLLSQRNTSSYAERETRGRRLAVAQERLRGLGEQEGLLLAEIGSVETDHAAVRDRQELAHQEAELRRRDVDDAVAEIERLRGPLASLPVDRHDLEAHMVDARARLEAISAERAAWLAQVTQHDERLNALDVEIGDLRPAVQNAQAAAVAAQAESIRLSQSVENGEQAVKAAEADLQASAARLAELDRDQGLAIARSSDVRARVASLQARMEALRTAPGTGEAGAGHIEQAVQHGLLKGIVGRLGRAVRPQPAYRRAILAALGEFQQGLTFRAAEDLSAALDWMGANQGHGQAAMLPAEPSRQQARLDPPEDPDCLGNAAELADPPADHRGAVDSLLSRTLVVRDRVAARRILPLLPIDGRAVTLRGEVFYAGGQVVVAADAEPGGAEDPLRVTGRDLDTARADLQRAGHESERISRELEAVRVTRDQAAERFETAQQSLRETVLLRQEAILREQAAASQQGFLSGQLLKLEDEQQSRRSARASLGGREADLEGERVRLQSEVSAGSLSLEADAGAMVISQADARLHLVRNASADAAGRAAELDGRLASLAAELDARRLRLSANREQQEASRRESAEAEAGLQRVEEVLAGVEAEIRAGEELLTAKETERTTLEARESRTRAELQAAERRHSQTQIELARRQQELTGMQQRIEDDFGLVAFEFDDGVTGQGPLPLNGLVEHLPVIEELPPDIENQVGRLRLQIRRMGAVNIEAKREYEEVRQRAEFLTSQLDDSRRAESQIREVIAELDHLMEREFRKTFEAVASAFRQSFTQLFGGGSARLVLTDDHDLTNTGIDIEARLPGRREHGLAMLSGGERSLTACALIFSLLKVSPTPFCVLDEVDAMLDEANVGRFCDMLRELSLGTQFIVITHNRQTIQAAEVVYGVSMAADSASRVISLKLDEAERLAAQRT